MTVGLPPRARRIAAALAGALAAATFAAGCSSHALTSTSDSTTSPAKPPVSAPTSDPPPLAPVPTTGVCRDLRYADISRYSNAAPLVPCTARHTSYTFAVRMLPAAVTVPGVSVGNKSIQDAASTGCRSAYARFIGGTPADRALARLSVTYFLPEQRDFDRGSHWVRCDVVALQTATSLAPLPHHLQGFLDQPHSLDDFGVCTRGVPGASGAALVMCTQPHDYRALAALRLGADSARYPGVAVAGKGGQQRCSAFIASALGRAGGYKFGWTFPTAANWAAGQRFGYCWNRTQH